MKFVVEALVPVTINCVEAPAFSLKKGEKKEFTSANFLPYSANINGAVQAGWVKVEVLEEGKADPKAAQAAAEAKAKAEKEAAEAKAAHEAAEAAKKAASEAAEKESKEQAEAEAAKRASDEAAAKAKGKK